MGIDSALTHHGEKCRAGERGFHKQARDLAHAIERLVRTHRNSRGPAERRAHGLVAPAAQVECPRERNAARLVLDREDIFAAFSCRKKDRRVPVRERRDGNFLRDRRADMLAVPRMPAVRVLAVGVDRIDALDLRMKRLSFRPAFSVWSDACDCNLRLSFFGHAQPCGQRRTDIVRIIMARYACAGRRRPAAVLKYHALDRGAHRCLRPSGIRPDVGGKYRRSMFVERLLFKGTECRFQFEVVIPEMVPLPFLRLKREVLEVDGPLACERRGRAAVEVFGLDRECKLLRDGVGCRFHHDSDLRRREILDLDRAPPQAATVLARQPQVECPCAALLVGWYAEVLAGQSPVLVGYQCSSRVDVAVRSDERDVYRKRLGSLHRPVAKQGVEKDRLVVPVDAALRPEERRASVRRKIVFARAVRHGLVYLHGIAERKERHVVPVGRRGHHNERRTLRDATCHAPAVRVRDAFGNLDVRRGEDVDPAA